MFVVNEISADKNKNLYKKYENDSRWDEGYDFREMVTYDMLTDSQNELRVIFGDNIAEYFNKYIDPITGHNRKKATVLYNERHQEQHCKKQTWSINSVISRNRFKA